MAYRVPSRPRESRRRSVEPSASHLHANAAELEFPMATFTENRLRAMHPKQRGRILKQQRHALGWYWKMLGRLRVPFPVVVTFTRIARRMDRHDSLPAAFKHLCDEVTRQLGLTNDDTPLVEWRYAQEPPNGREPAVRIRIETKRVEEAASV